MPSLVSCIVAAATLSGSVSVAQALTISSSTETSPYPGVRLVELRTTAPSTRAWVAYVDLCSDYVHVDATPPTTTLRTAASFANSVGAQLATNGDFYRTGPLMVYGPSAGGGMRWPSIHTGVDAAYAGEWFYDRYGWIAFGEDWVEFSHSERVKKHADELGISQGWTPDRVEHAIPPGTIALVSGFPELVIEGQAVTCASPTATSCFPDRGDMRARHPRTAMGLSEDRQTLMLVTVDGRTSLSSGMYGSELAELMSQLGAWEAFNLDGGGSTQMWMQGEGYVNNAAGNNGGASVRGVANHWGIFAGAASGKAKKPGHCAQYLVESQWNAGQHEALVDSDIDGDGIADFCVRGSDGMHCTRSEKNDFGQDEVFVTLSDEKGWNDLNNAATLRMGDIDGDGRADLCGRANAGMRCWLSQPSPLSTEIVGPELSDDADWNQVGYYSTIRLADINGDGLDDLCARAGEGFRCYPSLGDSFGPAIQTSLFTDLDGFTDADNYASLRMGDINGDGLADVCARADDGMRCALSTGTGFSESFTGPLWSDDKGWHRPEYWSTIRLVDVNADGLHDLCARSSTDFRCHLSLGDGFAEALSTAILSNDDGFTVAPSYSSIRMADIDGDRDLDLCARLESDVHCWLWSQDSKNFADELPVLEISEPNWADYASIRLADVTGDGRADLCWRDGQGLQCASGEGAGFDTSVPGPRWAGVGWESSDVWGTLMGAGTPCVGQTEICDGIDNDCDGQVDNGCDPVSEDGDSASDLAGGCQASGGSGGQLAAFLLLCCMLWIATMRRRGALKHSLLGGVASSARPQEPDRTGPSCHRR